MAVGFGGRMEFVVALSHETRSTDTRGLVHSR